MSETGFLDIRETIGRFKANAASMSAPYDKDFGPCTVGHDVRDVLSQGGLVFIGDRHTSPAVQQYMAQAIRDFKPHSLVLEKSFQPLSAEELRERRALVEEMEREKGLAATDSIHDAAEAAGVVKIAGDVQSFSEKRDLLKTVMGIDETLSTQFFHAANNGPGFIEAAALRENLETLYAGRRHATDPVLAEKTVDAYRSAAPHQDPKIWTFWGYSHLYHAERLAQEKLAQEGMSVSSSVLYPVPVNPEAMEVLHGQGAFQVRGQYVVPVLEEGADALSLPQFVAFLDTVPGVDPDLTAAVDVADPDAASRQGYDAQDLRQCAPVSMDMKF